MSISVEPTTSSVTLAVTSTSAVVNKITNLMEGLENISIPPLPSLAASYKPIPTRNPVFDILQTLDGFTDIASGTMKHGGSAGSFSESEIASYRALLALNSISLFSCLMVLVGYFWMLRKYPGIMQRLSLKLCACMAATELLLHTSNLVGYGKLPSDGFVCGFFGGALFAGPSLASLFYTCAIALNCQLVFVFARRPSQSREKYFIWGPPILALLICIPTLASGAYGYDEDYEYCWYATKGLSNQMVILRMLTTYGIWCMLGIFYLFFSVVMIIRAVFSSHSATLQISATVDGFAAPTGGEDIIPRREAAIRRLTYRLLGYISIPIICFLSGVVLDIVAKSGTHVSPSLDAIFECISGSCGLFNGILFLLDPAVLAIKDRTWRLLEDDETRPRPYQFGPSTPAKREVDLERSILEDDDAVFVQKLQDMEKDLHGL